MKNLMIFGGILLLCGAYTYISDNHGADSPSATAPAPEAAKERRPLPTFTFTDIKGQNHAIGDYKDRAIVLNFWASWCAPCVVEFPQMLSLAQKTKDQTVFVFLSVDDTIPDIRKFLARKANTIKSDNVIIGWDKDKSITQGVFQTHKFPETYLIRADQMIDEKIIGSPDNWDTPEMKERLEALSSPR